MLLTMTLDTIGYEIITLQQHGMGKMSRYMRKRDHVHNMLGAALYPHLCNRPHDLHQLDDRMPCSSFWLGTIINRNIIMQHEHVRRTHRPSKLRQHTPRKIDKSRFLFHHGTLHCPAELLTARHHRRATTTTTTRCDEQ
jgi:hypothetical protein